MKQVLIIHGGNSYNSRESYLHDLRNSELAYERLLYAPGWKHWLVKQLPDTDILLPWMPNRDNAVYGEWVIWFEKILPYLQDDVRLVGHSLGAMFLVKYLNSRTLSQPARQLHLIAGGYDDESNEDMGSFRVESAAKLPQNAQQIHLWHSQDDPVVPFTELAKFEADLPDAVSHVFADRAHFNGPTFPELVTILKQK